MKQDLEKFIRANRQAFDDLEPSAAMWQSIEARLATGEAPEKQAKRFSLSFVLAVAACAALFTCTLFFLYFHKGSNAQVDYAGINASYARQQLRFTRVIRRKTMEIKSLTRNDPALYAAFSEELAQVDSSYRRLNSELNSSFNRERVLRAMIANLQVQSQILNEQLSIIEQYKQMKNEQQNGFRKI